jgi:hypothetical protein
MSYPHLAWAGFPQFSCMILIKTHLSGWAQLASTTVSGLGVGSLCGDLIRKYEWLSESLYMKFYSPLLLLNQNRWYLIGRFRIKISQRELCRGCWFAGTEEMKKLQQQWALGLSIYLISHSAPRRHNHKCLLLFGNPKADFVSLALVVSNPSIPNVLHFSDPTMPSALESSSTSDLRLYAYSFDLRSGPSVKSSFTSAAFFSLLSLDSISPPSSPRCSLYNRTSHLVTYFSRWEKSLLFKCDFLCIFF